MLKKTLLRVNFFFLVAFLLTTVNHNSPTEREVTQLRPQLLYEKLRAGERGGVMSYFWAVVVSAHIRLHAFSFSL